MRNQVTGQQLPPVGARIAVTTDGVAPRIQRVGFRTTMAVKICRQTTVSDGVATAGATTLSGEQIAQLFLISAK